MSFLPSARVELCFVYPSDVSVEEHQWRAEEIGLLAQCAVVPWKPVPLPMALSWCMPGGLGWWQHGHRPPLEEGLG